jgi:hypothetical protein
MSKGNLFRWIPLFLSFFIIAAVVFLTYPESKLTSGKAPISKKECVVGEMMECNLHGCKGYRICRSAGWSECIIPMQCKPGDKRRCYVTKCKAGWQTCNECGEWGECVLDEEKA